MKHLSFLLLLLPLFVAGQQGRELSRDTSFFSSKNGKFYETRELTYDNGEVESVTKLLGDTSVVASTYVSRFIADAQTMSSAAVVVMQKNTLISRLAKLDTVATALLGRSPLTQVMQIYDRQFLDGSTWTANVSGTSTAVTFSRNTAGRVRMTPQGSTARTMLVFGTMIRLVNWPTTNARTDLFEVKAGKWSSIDGTIALRKN